VEGISKSLLVHSVQLRWTLPTFVDFKPVDEKIGDVTIKVGRDLKRRLYSGFIGHQVGMNLDLFRTSLEIYRLKLKELIGSVPSNDELQAINVQFNRDFQGLRLEGLQAMTVTSILGVLERFYNKNQGLRTEIQVGPISVRDIEVLLRGGVTGYNLVQSNFALLKEIRNLKEVWIKQTPYLSNIYRLLVELINKL
jgi:hypothetical protein